jgi:hypothetical protein
MKCPNSRLNILTRSHQKNPKRVNEDVLLHLRFDLAIQDAT